MSSSGPQGVAPVVISNSPNYLECNTTAQSNDKVLINPQYIVHDEPDYVSSEKGCDSDEDIKGDDESVYQVSSKVISECAAQKKILATNGFNF